MRIEGVALNRDDLSDFFWNLKEGGDIQVESVEGFRRAFRKRILWGGMGFQVESDLNQISIQVGELGRVVLGRYTNDIRTKALRAIEGLRSAARP